MSAKQKVLILWGCVLGMFAVFNLAFWPVARHQAAHNPHNFLGHAQALHAVGETSEAIDRLSQGIATHRPPHPEPIGLLREWHVLQGNRASARALEPAWRFYRAWTAPPQEDRAQLLQEAVIDSLAQEAAPRPRPETAAAAQAMALRFSALLDAEEAVEQWTIQEQLALLRLSGGPVLAGGEIGGTGVVSPVDMLAQSGGGEGEHRMLHLFAGGRSHTSTRRGFHVVVLRQDSGEVRDLMHFDIWASAEEAQRMAEFLEAVPEGSIGLFAVMDDAAANLSPRLEAALLDFGLEREALWNRSLVLLGPRYSFAAIGVKGAPPGTALQVWCPGEFQGHPGHPVALGIVRDMEAQP